MYKITSNDAIHGNEEQKEWKEEREKIVCALKFQMACFMSMQ